MMAKKEKEEPTFDKQMMAYSEENNNPDDPIFSKAYHKFMVGLLKKRDTAIKNELIETLSEVLKPFYTNFETIIGNQENLQKDINYLKEMASENRNRIESLEVSVDVHNKILSAHNKLLEKLSDEVKRINEEHGRNHPTFDE